MYECIIWQYYMHYYHHFYIRVGITLNLFKSLHNQGVLEQEKITLIRLQDTDIVPVSPTMLLGGDALEVRHALLHTCTYNVHVRIE